MSSIDDVGSFLSPFLKHVHISDVILTKLRT